MALLKFLIPILFLVFSFGEILRVQLPNSISFGLIDSVILTIILVWLFFVKKTNYVLLKPVLIFTIVGLFSLIINFRNFESEQLLISSLYLFRWFLYAGLYFVFVDVGKKFGNKIFLSMFISGLIILIIGFLQFFFFPSLKSLLYLGWDEHMYRLFGSFLDPNFAGVILVLFFVFIFIFRKKLFPNKNFAYYALLTLVFITIIFTYSRGAILMLVVCLTTYSFFTKRFKPVLGIFAVLALVFLILSPRFYIENTNLLRTFSTKERIKTWEEGIKIFKKNPLGIGFNTLRYEREKMYPNDKYLFVSHSGAGLDSSFIFILTTTGIPGIIAYVYVLFKILRLGLTKMKKGNYGLVLVISLGGLIVNSLFINSLFYSFIMIWLFTIAGLTEST